MPTAVIVAASGGTGDAADTGSSADGATVWAGAEPANATAAMSLYGAERSAALPAHHRQ